MPTPSLFQSPLTFIILLILFTLTALHPDTVYFPATIPPNTNQDKYGYELLIVDENISFSDYSVGVYSIANISVKTTINDVRNCLYFGHWFFMYDDIYLRDQYQRDLHTWHSEKYNLSDICTSELAQCVFAESGDVQAYCLRFCDDVPEMDEPMWMYYTQEFQNPYYPYTYRFCVQSGPSDGYAALCRNFTFHSHLLENVNYTIEGDTAGSLGNYSVQIECKVGHRYKDNVIIELPDYDEDDTHTYISPYIEPTYSNVKGMFPFLLFESTKNRILIVESFTQYFQSHLHIEFKLINFRLPLSTRAARSQIIFHCMNDTVGPYQYSKNFTIQMSKPSPFYEFTMNIHNKTRTAVTDITFSFLTPEITPKRGVLEITFPDLIPLSQNTITFIEGIENVETTPTYTISNQTIQIVNFFPQTYDKDAQHTFKLGKITMPSTARKSESFKIVMYDGVDSERGEIYALDNELVIQSDTGYLGKVEIIQRNTTVNAYTTIDVSITLETDIDSEMYLVVTLPREMSFKPRDVSTCSDDYSYYSSNININMQCEVISKHQIKLTNAFDNAVSKGNTITFSIKDVKNHYKALTTTSTSAKVSTHLPTGEINDITDNGMFFTFTSATYVNYDVSPLSLINDDICYYNITIYLDDLIFEKHGIVVLTVPNEIQIISNECYVHLPGDIQQDSSSVIVNKVNANTIEISGISSERNLIEGETLVLTIGQFRNPRTFKTTSSPFYVVIKSNDGLIISESVINNDIHITTNDQAKVNSINIASSNYINSEQATYTFTLTTSSSLYNDDTVYIKFPIEYTKSMSLDEIAQVTLTSEGKLRSNLDIIEAVLDGECGCYVIKAKLDMKDNTITSIDKGEDVVFIVDGVVNPLSLKQTASFEVGFVTADGMVIQSSSGVECAMTMLYPNKFESVSITPTLALPNTKGDYVVEFVLRNKPANDDVVIIELPSQVHFNNAALSSLACVIEPVSYTCEIDSSNNSRIIIKKVFYDNEKQKKITIKNLYNTFNTGSDSSSGTTRLLEDNDNTSSRITDSFTVIITDKDLYYKTEDSNNLTINFNCNEPCSLCSQTNGDYCTKCYNPNPSNVLYLYQGSCISECPSGYDTDTAEYVCYKCNDKCAKCDLFNPDKCTSCPPSFPFYIPSTYDCVTSCPDGTYADTNDNNTCKPCDNTCKTCSNNNSKHCTSCDSTSHLYLLDTKDNRCVSSCPDGTLLNAINIHECIACDSSCKTCTQQPSQCTSCNDNSYYIDNTCISLSQCKAITNKYANTNTNTCDNCIEHCVTCGNTYNECNTCEDNYVLYKGQCFIKETQCSDGMYLNDINICEQCDNNISGSKCKTCYRTSTTCTSCLDGFVLEDNKCVKTCSYGYYLSDNGLQCNKCIDNCARCSNGNECITCNNNYVLYSDSSSCISETYCMQLEGYYPNNVNGKCEECNIDNCVTCKLSNDNVKLGCTVCKSGFFIYHGICVDTCPEEYVVDSKGDKCISKLEYESNSNNNNVKVLLQYEYAFKHPCDYYIILVILVGMFVFCLIMKLIHKQTLFIPSFISCVSMLMQVVYLLLYAYSFKTGITSLFAVYSIIFTIHLFINCIYTFIFNMRNFNSHSSNSTYHEWKSSHKPLHILSLLMSLLFDYKTTRLHSSSLFISCSYYNVNFNISSFNNQYYYFSLCDILIIHLCSIAINIYVVSTYKTYDFLFYIGIYAIVLSVMLVLLSIVDNINISKNDVSVFDKRSNVDTNMKEEIDRKKDSDGVLPYSKVVVTTTNALMKEYVGMDMRREHVVTGTSSKVSFADTSKKISFVENRNVNENKLNDEGVIKIKKRLFEDGPDIKEEDEMSSRYEGKNNKIIYNSESNNKQKGENVLISPEKQHILTLAGTGNNSNKTPVEIINKRKKDVSKFQVESESDN